jgi:integrase
MHAAGRKRETIRKSAKYLAAVLDYGNVDPSPARDRNVRLPHEETEELEPPARRARRGRLPDDPGEAPARALVARLVGRSSRQRRRDEGRRLRPAATSDQATPLRDEVTAALWVELPDALADAIEAALPPREDRDPEVRLFGDSGSDALRTSIAKACKALAIPLFSPHDLRHRRISLLHSQALVGSDRAVRRPAEALDHGRHLHARPLGRPRGRLRGAACAERGRLTPSRPSPTASSQGRRPRPEL